jgi:hypothetical protein
MGNLEQPKINVEEIQEAANAAAKKAYLKAIEEYYTSYNSPYKKLIETELDKQKFSYSLELPDIMGQINKALSEEVDAIANTAIATSFIPKINKALRGLSKEINLSEVLKEIINELDLDTEDLDTDEYRFSYSRDRGGKYGWLDCTLETPDNLYEFILHNDGSIFDDLKPIKDYKYSLSSLPSGSAMHEKKRMIVYKDDIKIEMPFTPGILSDVIMNVFFKLILGQCQITLDVDGFHEDMFPQEEDCHC